MGNQPDREPCSSTISPSDDLSFKPGFGSPTNWILLYVSLKFKLKSVHVLLYIFNRFRLFELENVTQRISFFNLDLFFLSFQYYILDRIESELIYNLFCLCLGSNPIKHQVWKRKCKKNIRVQKFLLTSQGNVSVAVFQGHQNMTEQRWGEFWQCWRRETEASSTLGHCLLLRNREIPEIFLHIFSPLGIDLWIFVPMNAQLLEDLDISNDINVQSCVFWKFSAF